MQCHLLRPEYSEDVRCTICQTFVQHSRFRCTYLSPFHCIRRLTIGVSCPKFDMCRSCYQKVDEIHPAHAFLSLPDVIVEDISQSGPSRDAVGVVKPRKSTGLALTCSLPRSTMSPFICNVDNSHATPRRILPQLSARHRRTSIPLCRLPILVSASSLYLGN